MLDGTGQLGVLSLGTMTILDEAYWALSHVQARVEWVENATPIEMIPVQEGPLVNVSPPFLTDVPAALPTFNDLTIGARSPVAPHLMDMMNVLALPQAMGARPWPNVYREMVSADLDAIATGRAIRDDMEGTQHLCICAMHQVLLLPLTHKLL